MVAIKISKQLKINKLCDKKVSVHFIGVSEYIFRPLEKTTDDAKKAGKNSN
jgi:hypothetical protein